MSRFGGSNPPLSAPRAGPDPLSGRAFSFWASPIPRLHWILTTPLPDS